MNLIEQLVRDEGIELRPYKDSVGKLTIGVGRNLDDVGISRAEAMALLANDVQNARAQLEEHLPWAGGLDEIREAALVNMAFNLGIGRLLNFRNFLAALQAGDYKTASAEMMNSLWAKQVGPRAQRLALQIETGFWQ
jgi:lysozyme